MTRELVYPDFSVRVEHGHLRLTFRIPGSNLGPVEVLLRKNAAEDVAAMIHVAALSIAAPPEGEG